MMGVDMLLHLIFSCILFEKFGADDLLDMCPEQRKEDKPREFSLESGSEMPS
jgi:hypothetical protein